jgi:murein DD-endopeptidase MepM/ murein hydrolase activator NlpD
VAAPTPAPPVPSASAFPIRPTPTPNPRIGTSTRPPITTPGIPPSRLASEITGTKAPTLDLLTGYRWPVAKVRLTLPFGPTVWGSRLVKGERFHDGIDLATFCGDRVMAAHDGVVLAAGRRYDAVMGWVGKLGPYLRRLEKLNLWSTLPIIVVTDDGNGYRSMYAHFGKIVVKPGETVKAGQLLGYEGATGRASGCHVHYGLFSPWETDTFAIRPDVVKRMKVPKAEIARIDPLLVLPPKRGINAPKVPKTSPSPSPTTAPTATP